MTELRHRPRGWSHARLWRRHMLLWALLATDVLGCSRGRDPASAQSYEVGQVQGFSLRVESKVAGGGSLSFGASDKRYELRGLMELLPLSVDKDVTRVRAEFRNLSLEASDPGERAALAEILPLLAEPAVFTLRGGVVEELRVSPRMQPQAYGWIRAAISALQWPQSVGAVATVLQEEDGTGTYQARIERTTDGVQKTKLSYVKLAAQGIGSRIQSLMPEIAHSDHRRAPASGPAKSITVDEKLRVPMLGGTHLEVTTGVWLTAQTDKKRDALSDTAIRDAERALASLSTFDQLTPRKGAFDAERVAHTTLAEMLEQIERVKHPSGAAADTAAATAYLTQFSLLTAMLRQRPSDVERAAELIRSEHALSSVLIRAMGSAGTDQTQTVLRDLIAGDDRVAAEARSLAATSLIRVEQPVEPTLELMTRWASEKEMQEHGLYGLGTAARHLRERGQTERAQAIADWLGRELDKATDRSRVTRVLRGIANSADGRLLGKVKKYASDPDPGVRTAAIDALRFMENPAADTLLLERSKSETDTRPLRAILSTLGARKPSGALADAVKELAAERQRYGVRFAAVEQAGKWLQERAELRTLLEQVSRRDEREEVRQLAAKLLQSAGRGT